jgi:hypothetical protein
MTVDIALEAYEGAREALGTRGYKQTVNQSLHAVERAARLRRGADLIRGGGSTWSLPRSSRSCAGEPEDSRR